jgi:hypothetical protein
MDAPGNQEFADRIESWDEDPHGNRYVVEEMIDIADQAGELTHWL